MRLLCLLPSLVLLFASSPAPAGNDQFLKRYHFDQLDQQSGLTGTIVFGMLQDRQGFIWLGTEQGLCRYDGLRFKLYNNDPLDYSSLNNNSIQGLVEDRQGLIWLGTWGGGLNCFNPETDQFSAWLHDPEAPESSLAGNKISTLFLDSQNQLWAGTRSGGLSRMDLANHKITTWRHDDSLLSKEGLPNDRIWDIVESGPGLVWIGTEDGLAVYDSGTGRFQVFQNDPADSGSLGQNKVQSLVMDNLGQLWIGTVGGLFRADLSRWHFGQSLLFQPVSLPGGSATNILGLFLDSRELLWISAAEGPVIQVDTRDARAETLLLEEDGSGINFLPGFITGLEDRSNNLWLGGFAGLFKTDLKPKKFQVIHILPDQKGTNENSRISSIREDSQGFLWAAVHLGGLNRLDRNQGTIRNYLPGKTIHSILEDRQGRLWLGMANEGLQLLDSESGNTIQLLADPEDPASLTNNQITSLAETVEGNIWVGTEGGINLLNPDTRVFINSNNDPFLKRAVGNDQITVVLQDRTGTVWAGSNKRLIRFDYRAQTIDEYKADPHKENHLSDPTVTCLYRDPRGQIWVGTQAGLNRIDITTGEIKNYYQKDGLPDNTIAAILGDENQRLWISTNNRLCRFDPATGDFINYDTYDGLPSNSFREGVAFRSVTGELFFGTNQGLTGFFPQQVRDNPYRPPVVLTSLKTFNLELELETPLTRLKEFSVSHQDRIVMVEFAVLDFTLPEKNQYRYNLDSLSPEWVDLSEPAVTLTNLSYGTQTLRIQAANSDGIWNEQGLVVKIHRVPPFYRSWWAYCLYIILAAGLAVGLPYFRIYTLKKHKEDLAFQVKERTRELEVKNDQLGEKNRQLLIFDEIIQTINREFTMESLLQVLLQQGNKLFHHADVAAFMIFDYQLQQFRFTAVLGTDPAGLKEVTFGWNEAVSAYTQGHETLADGIFYINDLNRSPKARALAPNRGARSMVVLSVVLDGLVDGFLMFESQDVENSFSDSDLDKLKRFRQHTISAIAKARNLKELAQTARHLKETQQQLMLSAHHAGMAEVATNILHNVGNTLNSITTSAEIMQELCSSSVLKLFDRIGLLLGEHADDIMTYFTVDEKGKQIPAALSQITPSLARAHEDLRHEARELLERVQILRDHLADQEEYTTTDENPEPVDLDSCLQAILISERALLESSRVKVIREVPELPRIELQKTRFLRILEVLITNAVEAMSQNEGERKLVLRCYHTRGRLWLEVEDNGCGIDPNDQHLIFNQGFTTKKRSSSFGLHYCANVVKEMGGRIKCNSPGPGLGTRFILDLPGKQHSSLRVG